MIEEIVVTAQKRAESINSVPMSVTAISADTLRSSGVVDTADLAKVVPGFSYTDSGFGTPVYFIRGIGFFDTSLAAKPTVGIYVDEVPLAFSAMTTGAVFDLQRVEVLKGPQGTLFGQNSTGGAINYVAAKPTDTFKAGYDIGAGNFNSSEIGGFVSGPLSDTLRYRVALKHTGSGGWQKSMTRAGDTLGAKDLSQGRILLDWQASEKLKLGLNLNGFTDRSDTQAPQFVDGYQQSPGAFIDPRLPTYPRATDNARQADWGYNGELARVRDNKLFQTSLRADYAVNERTDLTWLGSYARYEEDFGQDADGTVAEAADLLVVGDVDSYNQELRLAGRFERGDWVVGVNYALDETFERITQYPADSSSGRVFSRPPLNLPPMDVIPYDADMDYESQAAFAHLKFDLMERLKLQMGARYTETDIDFQGCVRNSRNGTLGTGLSAAIGFTGTLEDDACVTLIGSPPAFGRVKDKKSESNTAWKLGLDWDLKPGLLYANVTRGFKSGGFPSLPGTSEFQYEPVDQEKVTAYEVGMKLPLLDGAMHLNGAVFYNDYINKQLKARTIVPVFGALEALINIPKSTVQGAELDLVWFPVRSWRLQTGVTYVETEVKKGSPGGDYTVLGGTTKTNIEGEKFPYTPEWQANADAQYSWSLSEAVDGFAGASLLYRGDANGDFLPDARLDIDAYTVLDLRAGAETVDGIWRVTFYGRNVTDEYYWTTATRRTDAIVRYAGMPRTYGLSLSYRFN